MCILYYLMLYYVILYYIVFYYIIFIINNQKAYSSNVHMCIRSSALFLLDSAANVGSDSKFFQASMLRATA